MNKFWLRSVASTLLCAGVVWALPSWSAELRHGLKPCRLQGVEHDALCGVVSRPFDPVRPNGLQIDIHFAVLPAVARNRKPDPVFFFAGGPGQSAIELAGPISRMLSRLSYRRDLVLIDQRGTGLSAPLRCPEDPATMPLAEATNPERVATRLAACRTQLRTLPYGDLRHFTTWLAVQDADAVRLALEVEQVNLVGVSYGTRVALEYMRRFPQAVRRTVLDGVAPPDMALPASFSTDGQAAFEGIVSGCEKAADCRSRYPQLRADWQALLAGLPRVANVVHPLTGAAERINLTRDSVLNMVRLSLYSPVLASLLPLAVTEAARGRFEPLLGAAAALAGNRLGQIAEGMHFSVVCAEDMPLLTQPRDAPGADFGDASVQQYRQVCAGWPRGEVPKAFYEIPKARTPVLLLSGGADPATPPRHGERVAQALGERARHVVVAQAGHGVLAIGCMREVLFNFIDTAGADASLKVDAGCVGAIPRPQAFMPLSAEAAK